MTTTPYDTDSAHDRRVRARLAERAAERGQSIDEVLAELNAALANGQPLPTLATPAAAPQPTATTAGRVVAQRPADDVWGVTTVVYDGPPVGQPRPCGGDEPCPWRRDARPGQFPAEAFQHSAATSQPGSKRRFGCHSSSLEQPRMCAGWLLRGAQHNAAVQRVLADGTVPRPELPAGVELYDSYAEMAVANGVAPDDPALTAPTPHDEDDLVPFAEGLPPADTVDLLRVGGLRPQLDDRMQERDGAPREVTRTTGDCQASTVDVSPAHHRLSEHTWRRPATARESTS